MREFERVIRREKFTGILQKRQLVAETVVASLVMESRIYSISEKSSSMARKIKIRDADDLIFVELAFEANADFIVSGDRHLLELGKVENTKILPVDKFLAVM